MKRDRPERSIYAGHGGPNHSELSSGPHARTLSDCLTAMVQTFTDQITLSILFSRMSARNTGKRPKTDTSAASAALAMLTAAAAAKPSSEVICISDDDDDDDIVEVEETPSHSAKPGGKRAIAAVQQPPSGAAAAAASASASAPAAPSASAAAPSSAFGRLMGRPHSGGGKSGGGALVPLLNVRTPLPPASPLHAGMPVFDVVDVARCLPKLPASGRKKESILPLTLSALRSAAGQLPPFNYVYLALGAYKKWGEKDTIGGFLVYAPGFLQRELTAEDVMQGEAIRAVDEAAARTHEAKRPPVGAGSSSAAATASSSASPAGVGSSASAANDASASAYTSFAAAVSSERAALSTAVSASAASAPSLSWHALLRCVLADLDQRASWDVHKFIINNQWYDGKRWSLTIGDPFVIGFREETYHWVTFPFLAALRAMLQRTMGLRFNMCLVHRYVPGEDHKLGFHTDQNENEVRGRTPPHSTPPHWLLTLYPSTARTHVFIVGDIFPPPHVVRTPQNYDPRYGNTIVSLTLQAAEAKKRDFDVKFHPPYRAKPGDPEDPRLALPTLRFTLDSGDAGEGGGPECV